MMEQMQGLPDNVLGIIGSGTINVSALRPITFTSFIAFRRGFLDVPDLGHREVSGIIVEGWCNKSILKAHT